MYIGKHEKRGACIPYDAEYKARHMAAESLIAEIDEFFAELELTAEELAAAAGIIADNARKIAEIGRKIRLRKFPVEHMRISEVLKHGNENCA